MSDLLNYFSPFPSASDESFERDRAKRFRTRLSVYLAISFLLPLYTVSFPLNRHSIDFLTEAAICIPLIVFLSLARSRQLSHLTLARLSIAAAAILTLVTLASDRITAEADNGIGTLLVRHLLAALILPWTWWEALSAAAVMVGVDLGLTLLDFGIAKASYFRPLTALIFSPGVTIPGVLISWYRHSRYRLKHSLKRDSAAYRSLARELESARRIHEATMPAQIVAGPLQLHYSYQPYRQLGGDLLFVHPKTPGPGQPIILVLLDVAGHGIPAALTVNRLVGELERLLASRKNHSAAQSAMPSPSSLALGLNRYVRLTLAHHNLFATAFIARIDPVAHTLTYVNCGHPPALLRSVPPGEVSFAPLDSDTFMLGVADEADMNAYDTTLPFPPGAALFACTDGATEARNPDGEPLLLAGFHALVSKLAETTPPEHWPASAASHLQYYRGPQVPADDDTLLVSIFHN